MPLIVLLAMSAAIVLLFSILLIYIARRKEKKAVLNDAVIVPALEEIFEDVIFDTEDHISEMIIRDSDMVEGYDSFYGNDYVRAIYNGMLIEMSDIHLQREEKYYDSSGKSKVRYITTFQGPWLICDFGKGLTAKLTLCERNRLSLFRGKAEIEMDNAEFNDTYTVLADNPHDAFYLLTPHMMEYILETNEAAGGNMSLEFFPEGTVHIAINSGHNAFEPERIWGNTNFEEERWRIIGEIRYITGIIDQLRLVDTFN